MKSVNYQWIYGEKKNTMIRKQVNDQNVLIGVVANKREQGVVFFFIIDGENRLEFVTDEWMMDHLKYLKLCPCGFPSCVREMIL